ncbi:MAG: precorrin-6y C5,15-methyltransferase (decarboxylating) subunit CbiE [Chloroflexi bacterium]|nr:precorrin-6y C5,15-methyltransferase (decarboxylating) subunit CbiE [Chloroflexota bacterium]
MATSPTGITMTVVAVGPGDPEFLTEKGRQALADADLVVGFKTVLDVVSGHTGDAEVRPMAYRDQEAVLDYAQEQATQGKACVVCVWGDLNVSAKELLNRVRRRAETVKLVPGISSVQIACARAGISLEESLFITLHQRWDRGSELGELVDTLRQGRRNVILLPRPFDFMPPAIAANAIDDGADPDQKVTVFQRLSLPDEQRWDGTLSQCAQLPDEFSDLSIMVFPRPAGDHD